MTEEEICVDLNSLSLVILYLHSTLKAFNVFIAMNLTFNTWNPKPEQGGGLGLFPSAKNLAAE